MWSLAIPAVAPPFVTIHLQLAGHVVRVGGIFFARDLIASLSEAGGIQPEPIASDSSHGRSNEPECKIPTARSIVVQIALQGRSRKSFIRGFAEARFRHDDCEKTGRSPNDEPPP